MLALKLGSRLIRGVLAAAVLATATVSATAPAAAATDSRYAAIVVDGKTGRVLFSRNADERRFPASLTKMMTLYLMFDALDRGRFTMDSRLAVSERAAAEPPSKIGVRPGSTIRVQDAILSLITRSANDVAVVMAEALGGSVSGFAGQMTATARGLGMTHTVFRNPNGLPDSSQYTSAGDMALLGRALQDRFPSYYRLFATRSFVWNGQTIGNHNNLLGRVEGVDGIKTGYTRASGYNLVTSVHRDNRYVVAVVMGGQSASGRDAHMRELITEYLPRASTGQRTAPLLVAAVTPSTRSAASILAATATAIAATAPLPRPRPPNPQVMALAEIDTTAMAGVILEEMAEGDADRNDVAAIPAPAPAPASLTRVATAARTPDPVAPAQPAAAPTTSDRSGWKIQIGAMPTLTGATETLARAQTTLPQILAAAEPYTEIVVAGNTTLYRARFGGFESKEAARAACVQLERRDFACLAIQ